MRRIEFRARWRDTNEEVGHFNEYTIDACNYDIFVVEQYTGVKDKNGKGVYEGDVVLFTDGNYGYVVKCTVIWSSEYNGWKLISNTGRPLFGLGDGSNIEVLEK